MVKRVKVREIVKDPKKRKALIDNVVRFCCSLEGHEHKVKTAKRLLKLYKEAKHD